MALFAQANGLLEIQSAVAFAERQEIRLVIVGGYDSAALCTLAKETQGSRRCGAEHIAYLVAGMLITTNRFRFHAACTKLVCGSAFPPADGLVLRISRNLPYQAGTAAAFGLSKDEALRAITLSAARILGVQRRVGSLTVGKDATLFVADGDILETPTQVSMAFVQGRRVSLNNRHRRLYDKFRQKYDRQVDE